MPARRVHAPTARHFVLLLVVLTLGTALRAQLVPITWSGTGDWSDTARWSLGLLPLPANSAQISSGTATVSDARSVGALVLSGGTLTGTGTLTITSTGSQWTGGTLSGAGTLALDAGSSLTIAGSGTLNARRLANSASLTWSSGTISSGNGAVIDNLSGATFSLTGDNTLSYNQGGTRTILNNAGQFNKSAGSGTSDIQAVFNNTGSVSAATGTLQFSGGGTSSGTLTAASGAAIRFSNDFTLADGSTLTGAGTVSATGGTLTANGAIAASNLSLAGATLAGTQVFTGAVTWSSGDWGVASAGASTTIAGGSTLTIASASSHNFNRRAIVNNGTVNWTGGALQSGNGGSFTNAAGATFTDNAASTINSAFGGTAAVFTNDGSFHKLSTGNTTISTTFNNNNSVLVSTGNLILSGGGTHSASATFNVDPGGTLTFGGGTHTLASGTTLIGSGLIALSAGNITLPSGNVTFENLSHTGGTLTGAGNITIIGYVHTGGSMTATSLALTGASSGWYGGDWNTSSFASAVTLSSATNFIIAGNTTHDFIRRTITSNGSVDWQSGQLRTGSGGGIVNNGTFSDSASSQINNAFGGTLGAFTNAGTYNKNASGATLIDLTFANTGTVNINAGTLNLSAGGTNAGGAKINVASGAGLAFSGGNFTLASAADIVDAGGSYTVSGGNVTITSGSATWPTLTISGGTLNFTNGGASTTTLNVSSGTLGAGTYSTGNLTLSGGAITAGALTLNGPGSTWTGGNMNAAGTLTIANGAALAISTTSAHDYISRAITNNGNITWSGGQLRTGSGGSITNNGTFTDNASDQINNAYGGARGAFTNTGTFNKNAAGTTLIDLTFVNSGTVNVDAGTLDLSAGGSNASGAKINVASGTGLRFSGGNFTLASAADIVGSGGSYAVTGGNVTITSGSATWPTLTISGGTLNFAAGGATLTSLTVNGGTLSAGNYTTSTLALSSGSIATTGNVTLTGAGSTWTGGNLNGAGTLTIGGSGTLAISTTSAHDFISRAITNNGIITWSGGQIRTGSGGSITNNGTFTDNASDQINNAYGGARGAFTNNGTFNKNAAGTTLIDLTFVNNGTVNLNAGTLDLSAGGSNASSAQINVASGTGLRFSGGNFTIASAIDIVDSGGSYTVAGGNVTVQSGSASWPLLTVTGGTLNFTAGGLTTPVLTLTGGTLGAGNYTTPALTLAGGAIATTGNVTLTGPATWTSGNMNGAGTLSIQNDASLAISTTNLHDFVARAITNDGTITWSGGQLRTGSGGSITNRGTFTDTASDQINNAYGGAVGSFNNAGTFNKNAAGTTTMALPFANTGTLNVNNGTFSLDNGGSATGASTLNLAAGATLRFGGGNFTFAAPSNLTAGGAVSATGGTTTFNGGTFALPSLTITGGTLTGAGTITTPSFSMSGGTLDLATLALTGAATWSAGNWNSSADTTATIAGGATLSLTTTNVHDFDRRTITNNGTLDWQAGQLRTGHAGSFINAAGATVNDAASSLFNAAYGGGGSFVNHGTYNKLTTGTSNFQATFDNDGVANVNTGTLSLTGGGTAASGGRFNIASGAALNFGGGNYTLADGASLTGSGSFSLTSGSLAVGSGTVTLPNLTVTGGTLGGAGSATIASLTQSSGSLGIAALTLTGPISWTGGDWSSASASTATLASGTTLNLTTSSSHDFQRRTITANGTTNWSGGYIRSGQGGVFNNAGTFVDTNVNGYTIQNVFGGSFSFLNNGTYQRNGAGTTSYIDVPFVNNGTLSVLAGDLQLRNGGSVAGNATVTVASGANLILTDGWTVANGVSLGGAGGYFLTNGTFDVSGALAVTTFNMSGGTLAGTNSLSGVFNWSNGTWSTATAGQSTTIASGGTLNLTTGNTKDFNRRSVMNDGTINWTGGYIRAGNGSVFTNNGLFVDTQASGWSFHNPFGGSFTIVNNGTYRRSGPGTTSFIDVPFTNNASVQVQDGDLQFRAGGTLAASGNIAVSAGANVVFTDGFTIANGASLMGAGGYHLTGGLFNVTGTVNVSTFNQSGGTLGGTNTLNGTFNWSNGTWSTGTAGQSTTIASGATLNLTTGSNKDFDQRSVINLGTVNWNGGYLRGGHGSVFTNNGLFIDAQTSGWSFHNPFGGTFTVVNNGTYRRDAANTSYMDTPFENNGTLDVRQGDFQIRAGGALASGGTIAVATGSNVVFTAGYNVSDGASLTGAGAYHLTGGTFTVTGTMNVSTFNQTGGRLEGTNTINGTYNWSGGDWSTGTAGRSTTIAAGATLNLFGGANKDLDQRSVVNAGTTTWTQGYIRGGDGGSFTTAAGGTFLDQNASSYSVHNPFGGTFVFANNGTYTRNAGGATFFDTTFNNNGTLNLQQGDIEIRQGGTMGAASVVNGATGTNLIFRNSYTLLDGAQFLGPGNFIQTGGNLSIEGTLAASAFHWQNGSWSSTGTSTATTIGSGTVLNLTTGGNKDFTGRAITNQGTVNWYQGYIRGGQGATFVNNGTFNDLNASSYTVHNPFGGTFSFTNNGSYVRNTGGATYFDAPFNNNGTVTLQQGDMLIRQGGTMGATSVVDVSTGANFIFRDNYTLLTGARFTGAGNIMQDGGTLTINGVLRASGFNWNSGNWNIATTDPTATTTIDGTTTLNLVSSNNKDFNHRTILNQGTVNWQQGYLRAGQGAIFENAAGGTFNDNNVSGYTVHNAFGGTFSFINRGNYVRNVGGATYFDVPFDNYGTVNLQQGELHLRQGGTMAASSVVNTSAGANLVISNDYTLLSGARFSGTGGVTQAGGTLTANGLLTADAFNWQAGNWNTGTAATTTVASGSTLNLVSGNNKDFSGRAIVNQGTTNWFGGYLRGGQGSSFTNAAGGVFNDQNASGYTVHNPFGGAFSFTNAGTYNKLTSGTTAFDVPFINSGVLNLNAGALVFHSTFTNSGGSLVFTNGASAQFSAPVNFGTAALTGSGTIVASSVTAGGIVSPGNSPGTLSLTGDLSLLATSRLIIELGGTTAGSGYDVLAIGGNALLAGTLQVNFTNGFWAAPANSFTFLTANNVTGGFTNALNNTRLTTLDGSGSFLVTYNTNSVALSSFQAIPEPSTYVLLTLGSLMVFTMVRRRRR